MIEIWIPITVAAAFFQNLRSALQKRAKGQLSTVGASYTRFLYALPVAIAYLWVLNYYFNFPLPAPNQKFYLFCLLGGISQIIFTVFLLWMFSFQSFAVGTTFSKLEVIMVSVLGLVILGDSLSTFAILAISISAAGVVALSLGQNKINLTGLSNGIFSKPTLIGLCCAGWLGASSVFFRGAALSLHHDQFIIAAAYTLSMALTIQTILLGSYLLFREPGEFTRILKNWRWASVIGMSGALASVCWFTAFTIEKASYVRAVGQIELVFTVLVTTLFFREKISFSELVGVLLVSGGIVILLIYG